ncbi:MAG: DUF120 domain-containing protein [Candidatus Thermoplasmatota archaeon]|jgi:riboflavin kinase|nr:DUF120 domain-containing protein [Candidatus Thermoplasmatota archaeon]
MMEEISSTEYKVLKCLRRLTTRSGKVNISTEEVAKMTSLSQQTASRAIIALSRQGLISRIPERRRQTVSLTTEGLNYLKGQLAELSLILGNIDSITVHGTVESGLGEGKYYISRKNYIIQFQQKLGYIPFLGTLNIRLSDGQEANALLLKDSSGITIEGFRTEDRTFGPVKAFRAKINGVECALIMPERTVHINTVEVISQEYLRDALDLKDGQNVEITVNLVSK